MQIKVVTPPASEPISLNEAKAHCRVDNDVNEIQALNLGGATGGTFTFSDGTTTTAPLAHNVTAAVIQTALEAIYGAGNVEVEAGFTIEFGYDVGVSGLVADFTGLTGSVAPSLLITQAAVSADDALITSLITAARLYCEAYQNRAYIEQTLEITLDRFPLSPFEIPRPPLMVLNSIEYTDVDGTPGTVPAASYVVDTDGYIGRVALKVGEAWPSVTLQRIGGVKIEFDAGYGATAASVPQTVKQAMLLLIGHWHEQREGVMLARTGQVGKNIEFGVQALLTPDRVFP